MTRPSFHPKRAEAVALLEQGLHPRQVAAQLDVAYGTVYYWSSLLKGVKYKKSSKPKKEPTYQKISLEEPAQPEAPKVTPVIIASPAPSKKIIMVASEDPEQILNLLRGLQ